MLIFGHGSCRNGNQVKNWGNRNLDTQQGTKRKLEEDESEKLGNHSYCHVPPIDLAILLWVPCSRLCLIPRQYSLSACQFVEKVDNIKLDAWNKPHRTSCYFIVLRAVVSKGCGVLSHLHLYMQRVSLVSPRGRRSGEMQVRQMRSLDTQKVSYDVTVRWCLWLFWLKVIAILNLFVLVLKSLPVLVFLTFFAESINKFSLGQV